MSKVYIALQDNDESRYIVEAIEEDNPHATVNHMPAMIRIENENSLVDLLYPGPCGGLPYLDSQ